MSSAGVPSVTQVEAAYCQEQGWVALDQLIFLELTGILLERAKAAMGDDGGQHVARPEIDSPTNLWQDQHNVIEEDPCFASIGVHVHPLRWARRTKRIDTLSRYIPAAPSTTAPGSAQSQPRRR